MQFSSLLSGKPGTINPLSHVVAYPGILFRGVSTNSFEDRGERMGIWGQ